MTQNSILTIYSRKDCICIEGYIFVFILYSKLFLKLKPRFLSIREREYKFLIIIAIDSCGKYNLAIFDIRLMHTNFHELVYFEYLF